MGPIDMDTSIPLKGADHAAATGDDNGSMAQGGQKGAHFQGAFLHAPLIQFGQQLNYVNRSGHHRFNISSAHRAASLRGFGGGNALSPDTHASYDVTMLCAIR